MRRNFLLGVLAMVFMATPVWAQVCSGDVTLESQADVDAFSCSEVEGRLFIDGNDITDLSPLSDLITVGEGLYIMNTALTTLSDLEGLTSVGWLTVSEDDSLLSLEGLEGITSLSSLIISQNDSLVSLSGLEGVTSIGGIRIKDNEALVSLAGLENAASNADPYASISIIRNSSLPSLTGLEGLTSISVYLWIRENDALISLSGLEGLTSVGEQVSIFNNDALQSLEGLDNLTFIGGDSPPSALSVYGNDVLSMCSCGLSGLMSGEPPAFTGVEGWVNIAENDPEGACTSPAVVLATPCEPVANEEGASKPNALRLEVYPNPVAEVFTLRYALPEAGPVRLAVYDLVGREVALLANGVRSVGEHEARLGGLAAGVYVVRIEVGEEVRTQRVTVVR